MNSRLSLLLALLAVSAPAISHGITLPVSEDAYATVIKKGSAPRVTAATGTAATLRLSTAASPVIRFEAGSLAADYPPAEVSRALLMVYFTKVTKPGDITIHAVSNDWTEAPGNTPGLAEYPATPIATIPTASVIAKQFAIIDVTDQVKSWLTNPASDFGFIFTTTGATSVELGAKEGPSAGYPAILQIERTSIVANDQLASGIDATKLGTGSITNTELSYLDGATSALQPQINSVKSDLFSYTATLADKVTRSGDTMTGPLFLPANGFMVGLGQIFASNNKVGINTGLNIPTATLQVRGDIKLGDAGNLQATAGEESLRIIRGAISIVDGVPTVTRGQGFTIVGFTGSDSVITDSTITFNTPFSEPPVITLSQEKNASTDARNAEISTRGITQTGMILTTYTSTPGITYHFIAIGPR